MLILAVGSGISGTWSLVSSEPLIPFISKAITSIPDWQKYLLVGMSLAVVCLAIVVLIIIFRRTGNVGQTETSKVGHPTITITPTKLSKKEHAKELQLLRESLSKTQVSAEVLVKLLRKDKQIPDRLTLEAKNNFRNTASRLFNMILAYGSNNENRMRDFMARLYRGDTFIEQCFGVEPNYHEFKVEIIENFESIAEDAQYVILNWKQLGFVAQD